MGALRLLQVVAAIITWFLVYSACVVCVKWAALGAVTPGRIPLSTSAYLSWWYVNATLSLWEGLGGWWLVDTKLLILFYRLMGSRVRTTGPFRWHSRSCLAPLGGGRVQLVAGGSLGGRAR